MLTVWTVLYACRKPVPVPVSVVPPAPVEAPEQATGCRQDVPVTISTGGIVVSAHPESTRIGADVLKAGGSAIDAATAMAVALTLVEPQSSGIGGGAFLLHHAADGSLTAWDGRETAPRSGSPEMFMAEGKPRPWAEVVPGGLSVGVPGLLRMLHDSHAEFGSLPFADLLQPTASLARAGFTVTPRMARSIQQMEARQDVLRKLPSARAYFYPDGQALQAGHLLKNPALADTLDTLSAQGLDAFYGGELGKHLVAAVNQAPVNPAGLTTEDLRAYRAVKREPVCIPYRGRRVCGHPPPTSGGVTTLQILGQIERFELSDPDAPEFLHLFGDSVALAWADRGRYLGDPGVGVPTQALLAPDYLAARSAMLSADTRASIVPGEVPAVAGSGALCPEGKDTTHLVVADAAGNVVSMTSSIENAFGSGVFVDGYLLNNQLTDFSREPGDPVVPNAAAACKRPRSSMSPLIVLDDQGVELALGSPGGSAIIQYVARVTLGVLDQDMTLQEAIERPNIVQRPDRLDIEADCGRPLLPEASRQALRALGREVGDSPYNSGLHGIQRTPEGWRSGIDPRREGAAIAVE